MYRVCFQCEMCIQFFPPFEFTKFQHVFKVPTKTFRVFIVLFFYSLFVCLYFPLSYLFEQPIWRTQIEKCQQAQFPQIQVQYVVSLHVKVAISCLPQICLSAPWSSIVKRKLTQEETNGVLRVVRIEVAFVTYSFKWVGVWNLCGHIVG